MPSANLVDQSILSFQTALQGVMGGVIVFIPKLIVAVIALVVLWVVASVLGKAVEQIVRALKLDALLQSLGAEEPISKAGFKLDVGAFFGGLVRWFFIIIAFLVAVDILGLGQVSEFLSNVVLGYIPNVIVAAVMIVVAAILADVAQKVIRGSAQAAEMPSAAFAGALAKWAIWLFAILAAIYQLNIVRELINTILTAVVAMFAIAGGLAFGLGGKEHASRFLDKLEKEMKEKK
ncbi:MAG: hypothetical protein AAB372_03415 [Patescibacteria group bacterium]